MTFATIEVADDARPTQVRLAATFAARMAASHGLNTFLVWIAFTSHSTATAGWVLAARAVAALAVPLAVGHLHDRGALLPWLRLAAIVEALSAMSLAWFGWSGASAGGMVALSLVLGATSSLFDTIVHPMLLAARPGRLRPHVLVGLSYDVAKVIGSSAVLVLIAAWDSPWPVMAVSLLALAGWRLGVDAPLVEDAAGPATGGSTVSHWRSMPLGPVVALGLAALLPGQAGVLQVALAEGSFGAYAVLGTSFALGAVAGNVGLQRLMVRRRAVVASYSLCGLSMLLGLVAPVVSFAVYGMSVAAYFQLTRVVVVEGCAPAARGRVSAAMMAVVKVSSMFGSVLAASLVYRGVALHVAAAAVAMIAAVVSVARRSTR